MMKARPPKWIDHLLEWYCKPELLEEIQGDLYEIYEQQCNDRNKGIADLQYLYLIIRFFKPSNIKEVNIPYLNTGLIRLNFKAGYRSLLKSRSFTFINLIGLCLSFLACTFIFLHVEHQRSYDKYHTKSERIVRVASSRFLHNELQYSRAMTLPEVGMAMEEYFPEIIETARIFPVSTNIEPVFHGVQTDGKKVQFSVPEAYMADSTFLSIFDVALLAGNPEKALSLSNQLIISEKLANRIFGHTDVIGEVLESNFKDQWTISGVYENFPTNSHFKPEVLMSWFDVYGERSLFTWDGFYTYALLDQSTDVSSLNDQLPQFKAHYLGDYLQDKPNIDFEFMLQPLEDIHLMSTLDNEFNPTGFKQLIDTLAIIGFLILTIAIVNHINLNTSKTIALIKSIGIRKVIGSSRRALLLQSLMESLIINFIAFTIALLLLSSFYPELNVYFGTEVTTNSMLSVLFWAKAILILIGLSVLSAIYPLAQVGTFKITEALKGVQPRERKSYIKQGLVTIQFTISLILIICTIGVYYQLQHVQSQDLGFDIEKKMVLKLLPGPGEEMDSVFNNKLSILKQKFDQLSSFGGSTVTSSVPGIENSWLGRTSLENQEALISGYLTRVDEDFIKTYNLNLIAGKNFQPYSDTLQHVLVNSATLKAFGISDPNDIIGKKLTMGAQMEIIGVVESFNEQSLHEEVAPSIYWMRGGYKKFLTVSLTGSNLPKQVDIVEQGWDSVFPDRPFEFFFLDDAFNKQYATELYTSRSISAFGVIAIIIAFMGLFALASITLHRKMKEISIRKVFGASVMSITSLFTMKFSIPLIGAVFLALPVSHWALSQWLQQFAYKMTLSPLIFVVPLVGLLLISLSVVIIQSVLAAVKNPVDILRGS